MSTDCTQPSRRAILAGAVAAPLAAVPGVAQAAADAAPDAGPDAALIAMAAEFLRLRKATWAAERVFHDMDGHDPRYRHPETGFEAMRARVEPWEDRCDDLIEAVLATQARTLHGIAAKAALLRADVDTALGGGPSPHANNSDWLGWSIAGDLAAMPELSTEVRALIFAAAPE